MKLTLFIAIVSSIAAESQNWDTKEGNLLDQASCPVSFLQVHTKVEKETEKNERKAWKECLGERKGSPPSSLEKVTSQEDYDKSLVELPLEDVKRDVRKLLTDSKDCWPADWGHYGPFFVRLAWHCSGTYRLTDGVGGCAGGRQRFDPEANWPDNTNLDKARALLWPIKQTYGIGLSWGDLFIIAGTESLRDMGAPLKRMCIGRSDDSDGSKSLPLGPSDIQKQVAPCTGKENGDCLKTPDATNSSVTTIGLIYVNPEGHLSVPDPKGSVDDIRLSFTRMGHGDKATVALIGGGHAFGKVHGACSDKEYDNPAGLPPKEAYQKGTSPYKGKCPQNGKGNATWTSGFEGPWTSTPTKWSNEYFIDLLDQEWEKYIGPGGHWQWRIKGQSGDNHKMRLTTDLALLEDENYLKYVKLFAANLSALDEAFDEAWFSLVTNGGGWSDKAWCDDGSAFKPVKIPVMLQTDA